MTKETQQQDEVKWDFFGLKIPDYLNDPIELIVEFVNRLPIEEEAKKKLIEKVTSLRK